MIIQYCSDLHLEFLDNRKWILSSPIIPKGDILILAGDIVLFNEMKYHQKFFDYVSKHFKHTYWIPGNHEYYNSDISLRYGSFEENIRDNVTLLNNKVKTIDGIRLVFSTLWSNISIEKQLLIQQSLSDFHVIRNNQKKLTVAEYNQMHVESRLFLENTLKEKNDLPTVVVTHHPPTFINYPEKYMNSSINEAFGTELGAFIKDNKIDYWIYGHHHYNVPDFIVGKTRLVTNQLGYIKYGENDNYTNEATFTL